MLARTGALESVRPGPEEPEELPTGVPTLREQAPLRAGTEPLAGPIPHWQVAAGSSPPDLQGYRFRHPAERDLSVEEAFDAG